MFGFLFGMLIVSSAGMALLLYAKNWELTTGNVFLPGLRPRLGEIAHRFLQAIERHLPSVLKRATIAIGRWLRIRARDLVARLLITIETMLQTILDHLKHGLSQSRAVGGQPTSAFLREVAEHKRKLTRMARMRRKPSSPEASEQIRIQ